MATRQETINFLLDQIEDARARKMFGEYAFYLDEKVAFFVCDDQLFREDYRAGESSSSATDMK